MLGMQPGVGVLWELWGGLMVGHWSSAAAVTVGLPVPP